MTKVEEILKQLVSFNTVGDKENGRIIGWIDEFCLKAGFGTEKIKNEKDGRVGLVVRSAKADRNGLIFIGHTDTMSVGNGWKTDPFELTQKGDDLFALGSADMKGGIAAMLAAMSGFDPSKLSNGLELIFTYDEEKNFDGIRNIIAKHKIAADCIVIGEPTSLEPVVATKGVSAFKIDFVGKEAHGSHPEIGVNAIEMACSFILELKKDFKKITKDRDDIFDFPCATMNIGKIIGGDAINKVPSACSLELEFRIVDNNQKEQIGKAIAALIKKNKFKAKVEETCSLPVTKSLNKKFIAIVEEITKKKAVGVSYAAEVAFLPGASDFVILGPGSIKDAHQANESTSKSSLDGAVKVYEELIDKFCV